MTPSEEGLHRTARVLVAPRVFGAANGIRFAPDGRLWVCSALGSGVGRVDVDSGAVDWVVPIGGPLGIPDDVDFDSGGVAYVTEIEPGRVSAIDQAGRVRVVADDVPSANGITVFEDRILIDESRPDGRLLELHANGTPHRVIAEGLPRPNALAVGPDRRIYFPIPAGEVWRVPLEGGPAERFLSGLGWLSSVTRGPDDTILVSELAGDLLEVDTRTGAIVSRRSSRPGIDNVAVDSTGRIFTSCFLDGAIVELRDGTEPRMVTPSGFVGPYGVCTTAEGEVVLVDGMALARLDSKGDLHRVADFTSGFTAYGRCIAPSRAGGFWLTAAGGELIHWFSGECERVVTGLDEPMGVAERADGSVVVAEAGAGRVLIATRAGQVETAVTGLSRPSGVAVGTGDQAYVTDEAAGTLLDISTGTVLANDLGSPQGVAVDHTGGVMVVDASGRRLISVAPGGEARTVASQLPVGAAPPGVNRFRPSSLGPISGPISPFAGIACGPAGTVYLAADADGSVLALSPEFPT